MVIQVLVDGRETSSYSSQRSSRQNLETGMKRRNIEEDCLMHSLIDLFSPNFVITQVHLSRDCVKLTIKLSRILTGKLFILVNLRVSAILILYLLKWKFLWAVILLLKNVFSCLEEKHLCGCWVVTWTRWHFPNRRAFYFQELFMLFFLSFKHVYLAVVF